MQVSNNYNNSQYFGMAMKADHLAKNALELRMKSSEWSILDKFVEKQANNKKVNIKLTTTDDCDRLYAEVFDGENTKTFDEGVFYAVKNPLKFIKKVCRYADKKEVELKGKLSNAESVLNKLS